MNFNGFLWISLDFIGFHWILMHFNGLRWISMNFNRPGPRLRELGLALLPTFGSPAALGGGRDPRACLRSAPAAPAEPAARSAPVDRGLL